jgi:hypothetical protein
MPPLYYVRLHATPAPPLAQLCPPPPSPHPLLVGHPSRRPFERPRHWKDPLTSTHSQDYAPAARCLAATLLEELALSPQPTMAQHGAGILDACRSRTLAGASAGEIGSLVWLTESKGNHQSPHETKACEHRANTSLPLGRHWTLALLPGIRCRLGASHHGVRLDRSPRR